MNDHKEQMIRWKPGFRGSKLAEAEDVYDELKSIASENGGKIVADIVVEKAKDEGSVLHPMFEWDDAKAAYQHRLSQAREVVRSIIIKYDDAPNVPPQRAFNVDNTVRTKEDKYKPYRATEDILDDDDAKAELLQRALNDLIRCRRRYRSLQELAIVFRAIDEALETMKL